MKKFIAILLILCIVFSLAGCVSQDDYDAVIAEKDALQARYDALQTTLDHHADLIGAMDAEDYSMAMNIIREKQIAKDVAEKGDIDDYLVTVDLTLENFDDYFAWKNFYKRNAFGEEMEYRYSSLLTSKVFDQGLILYDCDVKLGFTATVSADYFGSKENHSFDDTQTWFAKTMPRCGGSSTEGVIYDLEKCDVTTTRVEGTVTFVKADYVTDYAFDESTSEIADITLVNGEVLQHQISFGCKY